MEENKAVQDGKQEKRNKFFCFCCHCGFMTMKLCPCNNLELRKVQVSKSLHAAHCIYQSWPCGCRRCGFMRICAYMRLRLSSSKSSVYMDSSTRQQSSIQIELSKSMDVKQSTPLAIYWLYSSQLQCSQLCSQIYMAIQLRPIQPEIFGYIARCI